MDGRFYFGFGFDVHPLIQGRKLYIGGVLIPFEKGALGHSDGDALLHALIDASLSAAGYPDIGSLFPDQDPKYKDIPSTALLEETIKLLSKKQFRFYQVDLTMVLDEPKISPYYAKIKENLGILLKLPEERIGLKARRSEGVIFQKDKPAIASFALVVLEKTSK
uniref:2-C-methyl-D-erythritol 2,4-cyclodiphosphate synthase n=2 Tax=Caldimicrobium thiodismutans TaxID=1653476 RepID=A0A832GQP4_9BACT